MLAVIHTTPKSSRACEIVNRRSTTSDGISLEEGSGSLRQVRPLDVFRVAVRGPARTFPALLSFTLTDPAFEVEGQPYYFAHEVTASGPRSRFPHSGFRASWRARTAVRRH